MSATRILVVEDNPTARKLARVALEADGHEVMEAATGAQALALVRQGPDVVVLDLMLPDMHGLDLLGRIQQQAPGGWVCTVAVSGFAEPLAIGRARGGFDACLVKPVSPRLLTETVRGLCAANAA